MNKRLLSQKALSVICSATLAFGMVPTSAFAQTSTEGGGVSPSARIQTVAEPLDDITSLNVTPVSNFTVGKMYLLGVAQSDGTFLIMNQSFTGNYVTVADGIATGKDSEFDLSNYRFVYQSGSKLSNVEGTKYIYNSWGNIYMSQNSTAFTYANNKLYCMDSYGYTYYLNATGTTFSLPYDVERASNITLLEISEGHVHKFDYQTVIPSTCTVAGTESGACECGETKTRNLPLAAHSWGEPEVISEATCTVDGSVKVVCSVCNTDETRVVAATGHVRDSQGVCEKCGDVKATVESYFSAIEGLSAVNDASCGFDVDEDNRLTVDAIDGKTHKFVVTAEKAGALTFSVDAKCYSGKYLEVYYGASNTNVYWYNTASGTKTIKLKAGETASFQYDAPYRDGYYGSFYGFSYVLDCEHVWGNDVVTEPTCTTDGYTTQTCSKCTETQKINATPKLNHEYGEWTETKASTCTVAGEEKRECVRGDNVQTQAKAALGHDYTKLTEDGDVHKVSCNRCGVAPSGYDVVSTTELVEGGSYVLAFFNGGKFAMSCQPWSSNANTLGTEVFSSLNVSDDIVWTWTNGHLVSKDGKYLTEYYDGYSYDYCVTLTDDVAQALSFSLVNSGNKQYLKATTSRTYSNCLGAYGSAGGMKLVGSYDSYDKQYVTIYAAAKVDPTAEHFYVNGVCACGASQYVASLSAAATNLKMGETFKVAVTQNIMSASFQGDLVWDSEALALVGIEAGDGLDLGDDGRFAFYDGSSRFSFIGNDATGEGVVAVATFKVLKPFEKTGVAIENTQGSFSVDPAETIYQAGTPLNISAGLPGIKGDANNNGTLNIIDAQVTYSYATKQFAPSKIAQLFAAWDEEDSDMAKAMLELTIDVNNDGNIEAADAFSIQFAIHNDGRFE